MQVGDAAWVEAFKADWRAVEMSSADRAMLDYTEKLTREPASIASRV